MSPRSPRLELLVESRPGRDSLPFWPERGARLPTSGVLGKECWRGTFGAGWGHMNDSALLREEHHRSSPGPNLDNLASQGVPLSLSRAAAARAPPGRGAPRDLTHQPPRSHRAAGMLGRGGQTSSHGARGAAYFLTSPLRAKLSALGRIVGGTSARIASTGSCCAPPHPERTSFRPLPSPRGGTARPAATSERPRSWRAGRSSGPLRGVARPRIGIARGMAWRCAPTSRDRWLRAAWSDLDADFGTMAATAATRRSANTHMPHHRARLAERSSMRAAALVRYQHSWVLP